MTVVNVSLLLCHNGQTRASIVSLLGFLDHTELDTQPVGLFSTSDQLVAETATYTTRQMNSHALRGFRIRKRRNQAASDLHIRPHGTGIGI